MCKMFYAHYKRAGIDSDTVLFFPKSINFPEVNITDFLRQTALDIVALLKNPPNPLIPSFSAGDDTANAIFILANLLHKTNDTTQLLQQTYTNTFGYPSKPPQPIAPSPRVPPQYLLSHPQNPNTLPLSPFIPPPPLQPSPIQPSPSPVASYIYDANGNKQTLDKLLSGPTQPIWQQSASNEFGRLTQGNDAGVVGTDTMTFIHNKDLPATARATYASFVCNIKPHKKETHQVRLVVGGDRLTYNDDAGSPAAFLLETKILLNSVISDAKNGAKFMTCDLKDFYLATPMDKPEYMRISLTSIPQDIIQRYNIHNLATSTNQVYIQIKKGMYGLKQAAVLAYNLLVKNLSTHGYRPIPHTVGL